MDLVSLQELIFCITLLKYRYFDSIPSDSVPPLDNDTFATINTQSTNMPGEHWIVTAMTCQKMCFADARGCEKYFFPQQPHKQMMPAQLLPSPVFAVSRQFMQFFISAISSRKKLLEFQVSDVLSFKRT